MKTQFILLAAAVLTVMVVAAACSAPSPTASPPTAVPTPVTLSSPTVQKTKPGDKIGEMIVKPGAAKFQGPPLWAFCSPAFEKLGATNTKCDVPPLPEIPIGHGWFSADAALRDSNWKAMTWEMFVDDQPIDLNAFGSYDADLPQKGLSAQDPSKEVITKLRAWDVLLTNVKPGVHTLRSVVRVSQDVNDGFHPTKAGTYELVVNFTVQTPPPVAAAPTATQPPPTVTRAPATATVAAATATVSARPPISPTFPISTFAMEDIDGKWAWTFMADGAFEVTSNNRLASMGTFSVIEDRITLHDTSGSKSCKSNQRDGTYKWTFDGKLMRLEVVEDPCNPRRGTLAGSVWTVQR